MADDLEASTFLIGGALLRSEISVCGISFAQLSPLLNVFEQMGVPYAVGERSVTVLPAEMRSLQVSCSPYPGFPTDLQPLLAVLLSSVKGGGRVTDRVWRGRFSYVAELAKTGFLATEREGSLRVRFSALHGAKMRATDLRGGAACLFAALLANGESEIHSADYLLRGYSRLEENLTSLGADVKII
jgi:UDP-N-acetylglucosamine 1-carboxyvinyltransferase